MLVEFQYPVFDPPLGGVENYILEVGESLSRLGHQWQVFSGPSLEEGKESLEPSLFRHPSLRPRGMELLWRPISEYHSLCRYQREIERPSAELIVARHPSYAASAKLARGRESCIVYLPAEDMSKRVQREALDCPRWRDKFFARLFSPLWSWLERRASNGADVLMVLSQNMKQQMALHSKRLAIINPPGVDIERFAPRAQTRRKLRRELRVEEDELLVLTASRLSKAKNLSFGLELLASLDERVKYGILGGGNLRSSLEEEACKLGIRDRVIFTGLVDNPQDYYAAGDLYLHPATQEPFGHVLLEAMASALPVCAGASKGGKYLVATEEVLPEDCGVHLDLDEPVTALEQVKGLLFSASLRKELGSRARLHVKEKYRWEKHSRKLIESVGEKLP